MSEFHLSESYDIQNQSILAITNQNMRRINLLDIEANTRWF